MRERVRERERERERARKRERGGRKAQSTEADFIKIIYNLLSIRNTHTLMPTFIGERPAKGTFPVAISQRMTAKLYMSAALLSTSEGRCCRSRETKHKQRN